MGREQVIIVKDWETHKREEREKNKFIFWALVIFIGVLVIWYIFEVLKQAVGSLIKPALIVGLIAVIIYFLFKSKTIRHNSFFKDYLVWIITFSVGGWICLKVVYPYVSSLGLEIFPSFLIMFLISGGILEGLSKIMQILVFKHRLVFNKHLIFWIITQSLLSFICAISTLFLYSKISSLIRTAVGVIEIGSSKDLFFSVILPLILFGILQTIAVRIVWKTRLEHKIFKD